MKYEGVPFCRDVVYALGTNLLSTVGHCSRTEMSPTTKDAEATAEDCHPASSVKRLEQMYIPGRWYHPVLSRLLALKTNRN